MKGITVISGSPRKNGNTETLVRAFLYSLPEKTRLDWFHVGDMEIRGCIGCRKCWSKGDPCVIGDEMKRIYNSLNDSELILFVSPLYWFSWSAQIKRIIDRLYPFASEKASWDLSGKKAVLLSCGADLEPGSYEGLVSSFRHMCIYLGLSIAGEFCEKGLDKRDDALASKDLLVKMQKEGYKILSDTIKDPGP